MDSPQVGWFDKRPGIDTVFHWLMHTLFNGRAAVVLFFVISGFVLARQLAALPSGTAAGMQSYLVRRFFRIIPPMWVAVLFAYAAALHFHPQMRFDFSFLVRSLLLQDISLNIPLWSIEVEMICSVLFPLLYALNMKSGKFVGALLVLPLTALLFVPATLPLMSSLRYMVFFQLGILVGTQGAAMLDGVKVSWRRPLFLLAWLVFTTSSQLWPFFDRYFSFPEDRYFLLIDIPALFFILSYIVHAKDKFLQYVLRSRLCRHIGKISFSLYILHYVLTSNLWPIYGSSPSFTALWPYQTLFSGVFCLLILGVAIPLSMLVYKFVEAPCSNLGRRIGRRILAPAPGRTSSAF